MFSFHVGIGAVMMIVRFPFVVGAKIPLYAFKKLNKISKGLCCEYENTAPPFAFLDSLLLGEVSLMTCSGYQFCLSFNGYNGCPVVVVGGPDAARAVSL